jgi:hypothetical protein
MRRTPKTTVTTPNDPTGTGLQNQYMAQSAKMHLETIAKWSTNFFASQVQGLNQNTPASFDWYEIRVADKFASPNISATSSDDDWQFVYFKRPDITYVPPGAKFIFWNNTWLADNPSNIASVAGTALLRRCNAVWNSLDYYGNIVSEPMVISKPSTTANANTDTESMNLADSYIDCIMQANEWTLANLRNNTRMILGTSGFAVRGLSDYIREFTDQQTSVRILRFSLYYQEPLEMDDMVNQVAGGLAFSWGINISGPTTMKAGDQATLSATSLRNNDPVPSTQPITYIWSSSNEEIATVDETGTVNALTNGQVTITCTLGENENISTQVQINVQEARSGLVWEFDVPDNVPAYQSRQIGVDGAQGPVSWSFSGPDENAYSTSINGNTVTIMCYYPSPVPLMVTVTDTVKTLTAKIQLTAR